MYRDKRVVKFGEERGATYIGVLKFREEYCSWAHPPTDQR